MSSSRSQSGRTEPPSAEEVFAEFLASREAGGDPSFDLWVAVHPDLEPALRALYADWSRFESGVGNLLRASLFHRPREPREESHESLPEARPGTVLGDFRLERWLGKGAMGHVWEAEQLSLRRRVALKILNPLVGANPRVIQRFEREAEAGGRLNHPHIVSVHTYGEQDGLPFLALELVQDGCSLADSIRAMAAEEELPADYYRRTAELVAKVADALQVAHDAGVVHRDVKPQNVLVTPDDQPKVSDFGLARIQDTDALSQSGDVVGTYSYMSPEQARAHRSEIDHRTDVFSLGATLYEILTLRRAFEGDTSDEVVEKVLHVDPPDARELRADVPFELAAICRTALEKHRDDRYSTMRDLAADLRRWLRGDPISVAAPNRIKRVVRWARRRPRTIVQASVGLAAVVVIALLLVEVRATTLAAKERGRREANSSAQLWIHLEKMGRASEEIHRSTQLHGDDPEGHLLLAAGYAQYGRKPDARQELAHAAAAGFVAEPPRDDDAAGHFAYAVYLMVEEEGESDAEAERFLADAVRLDARRFGANYPLFKIRSRQGDDEGAQEALTAYRNKLPQGNDFYEILVAEGLEQEEKYEEAKEHLEELMARLGEDESRIAELRIHRTLGRIYLSLDRLDDAERVLERAIEEAPDDGSSIAHLADLHWHRAEVASVTETRLWHLDRAEELALRAREINPTIDKTYQISALASWRRLETEVLGGSVPAEESWEEARLAIAALRAHLDEPQVEVLESYVIYLQAMVAQGQGDMEAFRRYIEACLDAYPDHVPARVTLAQFHGDAEAWAEALPILERALDAWRDWERAPAEWGDAWLRPSWERRWLCIAHLWAFGAAAWIGDEPRARLALVELDVEAATLATLGAGDQLMLAWFLAGSPTRGVVNCPRAREIVEEHDLWRAFQGPGGEEARDYLERIRAACP